jgi:hypothetical protein
MIATSPPTCRRLARLALLLGIGTLGAAVTALNGGLQAQAPPAASTPATSAATPDPAATAATATTPPTTSTPSSPASATPPAKAPAKSKSKKDAKKGEVVKKPAPKTPPPPKAPVPNAMVAQLKPLAGSWTCTGHTFGPGPDHLTKGTLTFAWQIGGFWLESRYEEEKAATNTVPVSSIAEWGFDDLQGTLLANTVDNIGGIASQPGGLGWKDDRLVFDGPAHRFTTQFEARDTYTRHGDSQLGHIFEANVNDTWLKLHEDTCVRVSGGAAAASPTAAGAAPGVTAPTATTPSSAGTAASTGVAPVAGTAASSGTPPSGTAPSSAAATTPSSAGTAPSTGKAPPSGTGPSASTAPPPASTPPPPANR